MTSDPEAVQTCMLCVLSSRCVWDSYIFYYFDINPTYIQHRDTHSASHWRGTLSYSVWFTSRAKRMTVLLFRGSGLSSGGGGSPPAAPWEWWWLGLKTSSSAPLGGSTWLGQQRREKTKRQTWWNIYRRVNDNRAEHPGNSHFRRSNTRAAGKKCLC